MSSNKTFTLYNVSKDTLISRKIKLLTSIKDKALGLIIDQKAEGVIFHTRFGIHTIGLKDPIDVAILDNNYKVYKLKCILPNRVFFWPPKLDTVVELKQGILQKKIKVGDTLQLKGHKTRTVVSG